MKSPEDFLNTHAKTMETMTSMNRLASDVMRSISSMQTDYMQQLFQDMQDIMKAQHAPEKISQIFAKTTEHGVKIADITTKAHKEAVTLIHEHVQAHSPKKH